MFKTKDLQEQQAIARRQAAAAEAEAEALQRQIDQAKAAEAAAAAAEAQRRRAAAAADAAKIETELRAALWPVWEIVQRYNTAAAAANGMPSGKAAQLRKLTLQAMALCGYDMAFGQYGQMPVKR